MMGKLPKHVIKTPPPAATTTTTNTSSTPPKRIVFCEILFFLAADPKYLALLQKAEKVDMPYFDGLHLLTIKGKTKDGLPIVLIAEERIRKDDIDQVLLYIVRKLDKFVEQDYAMIWCINNTPNAHRPTLQWLLNTYRSIDYKYVKLSCC